MREYSFEYTKQGADILLFLIFFVILGLGLWLLPLMFLNNQYSEVIPILLITFCVLFFFLNKGRVKRSGLAQLSDSYVELKLDKLKRIPFSDLRYYSLEKGKNGAVFIFGFIDKTKFKIGANNNFCNDDKFEAFLMDLQSTIELYKQANEVNITHLKSVFARKNIVYILSALSVAVVAGFCFTNMPVMILPIVMVLPLIFGWIQYFQFRQNNELTDIGIWE
ncbi:hypothetical protein [Mucilaginibacter lacusdianchii]|uniref:hypothetical protein n=1 Tax=Mucilaginibacter lacusdianchii TaxID=2684211 RepID=UPI00131BD1F8|nr:hypothetical protein [Mucilaginibacter sp. JXJ CY 39]